MWDEKQHYVEVILLCVYAEPGKQMKELANELIGITRCQFCLKFLCMPVRSLTI